MGWRELNAWLHAMLRQKEGPQDDPHSWGQSTQLRQMQAERDRARQEARGY